MEIDRLFDEITSFETDNKKLRDINKNLLTKLNEEDLSANEKNIIEIKKLKQEIDDLNEELDELVQYKASFDSLKLDFDKLKAQNQLNSSQGDLNLSLKSPGRSSLTPRGMKNLTDSPNNDQDKSKLELEWIKGENEKLLLDLEKVQQKLDEKIHSYNELKEQLAEKDDMMNEFIKKYEKKETNNDDLLNLQKKVLDLEHLLSNEKEEKMLELEMNEERQKDLLKRNDSLWSQLTNIEQNYKETVDIVRQQTERINEVESYLRDSDENSIKLENQISSENEFNKKLTLKNDNLELELEQNIGEFEKLVNESELASKKYEDDLEQKNTEIYSLFTKISELSEQINELDRTNLSLKQEVESLNKEKSFIMNQNDNSHSKVMQDYLSLQEKNADINYKLNKANKEYEENAEVLNDKENNLNILRNEKTQLEHDLKQEKREKCEVLEKNNYLEALATKNMELINELSDKLHKVELHKSKLEIKARELETMELKCNQLYNELNEKRETLSQILETKGKLEGQINQLECKLNETKTTLLHSENIINELKQVKTTTMQKTEENITLKHDYENEKSRREKAEKKIEELKEEFKKSKQKLQKIIDENGLLKNETIETKNQLDGYRSKINMIADKSHTELEKNSALQDELSEIKKKLELAEVKCANYSDKFDLLLKKYETRKVRQKNKVERLWEYLQRERVKYKNLLANAQNDLTNTKSFLDKENEFKSKNESSNQQLNEEKTKLIATVADKDSKIREMKRQNLNLQSKIKLLEEEMETLHDRIDLTAKERNKYRKEIQLNLLSPLTGTTQYSSPPTRDIVPDIVNKRTKDLLDPARIDRSFKSNSMITSTKYWNDLTNGNNSLTSNWDVNYNTGYLNRFSGFLEAKPSFDLTSNNNLLINNAKRGGDGEGNYGGSMEDSSPSTPRSFR